MRRVGLVVVKFLSLMILEPPPPRKSTMTLGTLMTLCVRWDWGAGTQDCYTHTHPNSQESPES